MRGVRCVNVKLFEAVKLGDVELLGSMLDSGVDFNSIGDASNKDILSLACESGDSAVVEFLLHHPSQYAINVRL